MVTGNFDRPTKVGRVLDDGSSQIEQYSYNLNLQYPAPASVPVSNGNLTSFTDAVGRQTRYTYDSITNTDLIRVEQKTGSGVFSTLATMTYDSHHNLLSQTDPAGRVWQYTYNGAGQVISATNPLNQTRTWSYDGFGRLIQISVQGSAAAEVTFAYGGACGGLAAPANTNLPYSATDAQGYTVCYQYDALDRVTAIKYPDGTSEQYNYTFPNNWPVVSARGRPSLDLWQQTDRLGRVTSFSYDQNRRLIAVSEPVTVNGSVTNRTTQYTYYNNGTLKDIIDANGNVTHYERDVQSRVISKTYGYGSAQSQTKYFSYDRTGRLIKSHDYAPYASDSQNKNYWFTYNIDDTIATTSDFVGNPPQYPTVQFTYNSYFPRLTSMMDQLGLTTWTYKPLGSLGALQVDTENPPFANDTISYGYDAAGRVNRLTIPGAPAETFAYDALGRLRTHGTALGNFAYSYLGNTEQITKRAVTNGTTTLSTTIGYETNIQDRRLKSITHSGVGRSYGFTSNPYQITGMTDTVSAGHPWGSQTKVFSYDGADRLLAATATVTGNSSFDYDRLDNLTRRSDAGGTITPTYNGLNQVLGVSGQSWSYGVAGNLLSDGWRNYQWDGSNRLTQVTFAGNANRMNYAYDGLGRRVKGIFTGNGTTTESRFLWCGLRLCQVRDGLDNVTARVYQEGEFRTAGAQKALYLTDQLGSVRDVVDANTGALLGSLDYSPYGQVQRRSGSFSPLIGFAQLPWDANLGLAVSATRLYDPVVGRWISRDPLGEAAGINLFAYVNGSPTSGVDPEGLQVQQLLRRLIPFVRNQGPKIFERCKIGIDDLLRQFNRPNKGTPPLRFGDTQLGKKLGKHVRDFGGNPSNPVDRAKVKSIIDDIGNNPDKIINGTFSGQGPAGGRGPVQFRIKGNDVVVTKPDGEFVTILKDGLNNTSVKKALGQL